MDGLQETFVGLGVALGIGFLIGVDRERRKGSGAARGAAGVRTFVLVALLGAAGHLVGERTGLLLAVGVTTVLAAVSYWRSSEEDPGLTTGAALVLTCFLGGLALRQPVVAAGLGTLTALLLASRTWLHAFIGERLSDREIMDGLLLAGAGLVVLPVLPDRAIDPYDVVNPRLIWTLALLVMLVNAAGYVALRTLGPTAGLALSGLAGGFVSSVATIASMGNRSSEHKELLRPAVAGAALSSVATVVELTIIIAVTNRALLAPLWPSCRRGHRSSGLRCGVFLPGGARKEAQRGCAQGASVRIEDATHPRGCHHRGVIRRGIPDGPLWQWRRSSWDRASGLRGFAFGGRVRGQPGQDRQSLRHGRRAGGAVRLHDQHADQGRGGVDRRRSGVCIARYPGRAADAGCRGCGGFAHGAIHFRLRSGRQPATCRDSVPHV